MNWQQYEQYSAFWWNLKHPEDNAVVTQKDKFGGDGGIDVIIKTPYGIKLGQCKHCYGDRWLRVGDVKQLYADMQHRGVSQGIMFTSAPFSKKAGEYAKKSNIWIEYLEDPDQRKYKKQQAKVISPYGKSFRKQRSLIQKIFDIPPTLKARHGL